jgi:hypothetical protein
MTMAAVPAASARARAASITILRMLFSPVGSFGPLGVDLHRDSLVTNLLHFVDSASLGECAAWTATFAPSYQLLEAAPVAFRHTCRMGSKRIVSKRLARERRSWGDYLSASGA